MADKPYDRASDVTAEEGQVDVDGPDGVAVSLTPEAAVETGHRLLDGGVEAAGQRRLAGLSPGNDHRSSSGTGNEDLS